ncbi:MAG: exopolysaccharide biosynthesis polyprenyl glycosylphosphotransferase [Candidatus Eisenbacteria bacterium]
MSPDRFSARSERDESEAVGLPGSLGGSSLREAEPFSPPSGPEHVTLPASRVAHRALVTFVVALDFAIATAGIVLVAPLRYSWSDLLAGFQGAGGVAVLFLSAIAWLGALSARGAYRPRIMVSRSDQLARVLSAAVVAWLATHLFVVWFKVVVPFESRLVMGLSLPATLALFAAARLLLVRPLSSLVHRRLAQGPVLFIGDGESAPDAAKAFEAGDHRRRRVSYHPLRDFTPGRAASVVREQECGEVMVLPETGQVGEALEVAFAALDAGADVTLMAPEFHLLKGRPNSDALDQLPTLRLRRLDYGGLEAFFKRMVDVVGAAIGLAVLSPFLAAIALAVKLSSPGPVIFKQDRIGRKGEPFPMFKFRTMRDGNDSREYEAYSREFIREGAAAYVAPDGSKIYKPPADPRVTRIGSVLRKYSLDELPQLWNVLRGEMSLVGPRPCMFHEWALYDPWQKRRLDVLPGCTGLWPVRGRSRVRVAEMVILDLYYAHRGTLFTDARLIVQTVPVMLLGRGAY